MRSDFANTKGLSGLSDFTGVIESSYGTVRIIDTYPNAIKVQVQTDRYGGSYFRTPFACLDAFVAIRDPQADRIIGGSLVVTHALESCYGSALIQFNQAATSNHIILELYEGGTTEWFDSTTTLDAVKNGSAVFVAASPPINLDSLNDSVETGGAIQKGEKDTGLLETPALAQVEGVLKWTAIALAGGTGIYFLSPLLPNIKDGFEHLSDNLKEKMA